MYLKPTKSIQPRKLWIVLIHYIIAITSNIDPNLLGRPVSIGLIQAVHYPNLSPNKYNASKLFPKLQFIMKRKYTMPNIQNQPIILTGSHTTLADVRGKTPHPYMKHLSAVLQMIWIKMIVQLKSILNFKRNQQ